jgi:hypothetical protein
MSFETECTIVAGGPSLRSFDWSLLHDKDVLAINNAALRLPYARHVYFANLDWFQLWRDQLALHAGQVHQGVSDDAQSASVPWVRRWDFEPRGRFTLEPARIRGGGCSGNAAINLAAQLGYTRLHLLGYDFDSAGNFHNDHLWTRPQPAVWRQMFDEMLPELERYGIQIKSGAPNHA